MLEQQIQKKIARYLESLGAWSVVTITCSRAGTPDILACLEGRFIAIEVKRAGYSPTDIQQYQIDSIRSVGGIAFAASSVDDVKERLEFEN